MKPGLARMEQGLSLLGRPQDKLRVIHIAGTNGKGSTARMIQAMATANGWKTGLFTSPAVTGGAGYHQIDANPISEAAFAALTGELAALAPAMGEAGELSEFELLTTMAITWFAREKDGSVRDRMRSRRAGGRDGCIRPSCGRGADPGQPRPHGCFGAFRRGDRPGQMRYPAARLRRSLFPGQPAEALGVLLEEAAGMGLTVHVPRCRRGADSGVYAGTLGF